MVDLARFCGRQLIRHRAPQLAAALSYRTIFSLIPILVLSLIIFRAFLGEQGVRAGLEQFLDFSGLDEIRLAEQWPLLDEEMGPPFYDMQIFQGTLAPAPMSEGSGELAQKIQTFVDDTVARLRTVNFGAVAVVGVFVLVYAALTLIIQVEQAFNLICRAPSGRKMFARLITYWALLTLGPVFLVGGIVVSGLTAGWINGWPAWLAWAAVPMSLISKFGLTWLILLLAYALLPNTRLDVRPAAIGALVAAVLWESLKSGLGVFAIALTSSGTQFAVYGSIALVPLFLLWIYITWLIILFGLELAAALQTVASGRVAALERLDEGTIVDPAVSVVLVRIVAETFARGETCDIRALAERSDLAEITVESVVSRLVEGGVLNYVDLRREEEGITLARPADQIRVSDVISRMSRQRPKGSGGAKRGFRADDQLLGHLSDLRLEALGEMTIAGLMHEAGQGRRSSQSTDAQGEGGGAATLGPA